MTSFKSKCLDEIGTSSITILVLPKLLENFPQEKYGESLCIHQLLKKSQVVEIHRNKTLFLKKD